MISAAPLAVNLEAARPLSRSSYMLRSACAFLAVLLCCAPVAQAADPITADEVLRRAEAQFAGLTDYECEADAESRLGTKTETGSYRIWFRKPALLRVKVLAGRNRGSEVVLGDDGKVHGRKGGLLKAIVIRMSATDGRLRSLRGLPVTEFDWGSFYRKLRERGARLGAKTVLATRAGAQAPYELVLTYHDAGKSIREVYRIDPRLWVMTEGEVYEDHLRVDHVVFRDVRLNSGVSDRWFRL